MGRLEETERLYRETLERLPDDLMSRNGLASVLRETKRLREAERLYRETLRRWPHDLTARSGLGDVLREMDRLPELEHLRSRWTKMDHSANSKRIFSELAAGRPLTANRKEVSVADLAGLLNRLIADISAISDPNRGLRWTVSGGERLLDTRLMLDLDLLEQAVMNVLDNAAKYSYENSPVNIELTTSDKFLIISVSNRGLPITPLDARKIVDRGFRGAQAETVTAEGMGIGLWVTDQLLKVQGGTLEIVPTSAEGITVVRLRFSLAAPRWTRSRA
jgi:signal transduction histidine kinase